MFSLRSRASSDARTLYVPLELLNARRDTLSIISSITHYRIPIRQVNNTPPLSKRRARRHYSARILLANEPLTL